jgi:hypothetical protein
MTEYENYHIITEEKDLLLESHFVKPIAVNEKGYIKSIEFLSNDFMDKIECIKLYKDNNELHQSFKCEKNIKLPINEFGNY